MAAYMITYDLNSTGQKYDQVIQAIKNSSLNSSWCSYWKSSWLIKSNLSPTEIQQKIKPYLDSNDRLFIVEIKNNYSGWLTDHEWEYIRTNIFN